MNKDHPDDQNAFPEVRLVLATFPDLETARQIGSTLVESQLVACVNLIPNIESIYRWKGEVTRDAEILGLFKTTEDHLDALRRAFVDAHPYEVPEFLVLPRGTSGFMPYLEWVAESTRGGN